MEKIQAALEKARNKRGSDANAQPPRSVATDKPTTRGVQAWADLREITLSKDYLDHHRIVTQTASEQATPFDIMRTKILLQMRQNGWKSIAITSPMPKCGKTTTACNLALGLGRQNNLHAVLFDMDLESPSVSDFFGFTPEIPIADVLSGKVPFAEQAVRIGTNVAISASRQTEIDPTRILLTEHTTNTLTEIQSTYDPDIMIYDMPAILVGDNTRAFLKNVDCALIIVRANGTRYGHFDACEREIAEYTNVLGVVLNAFQTRDLRSYID